MVEYSSENRFPFHQGDKSVSLVFDDHEDLQELDMVYNMIVERFPSLRAELFYSRVQEIQNMGPNDRVEPLKEACDRLLREIRKCLADEDFIHGIYD